ncbi:MAG: CDP-alcohol phosphatidyltransferase family protein [Methylocystis sp.]|nr:CDP-alcohol phosphatidyltransferase family protein [Methylocystis sp.]
MAPRLFAALPNLMTVGRIALTPVAVALILRQNWTAALGVFAVAGVSDALDGWLAKRFGLESELGALLDPIADKSLIVSTLAAMAFIGVAPLWLTLVIIARDAAIVSGVAASWLLSRPVTIQPHIVSKATTAAQLLLIGDLLAEPAFGVNMSLLTGFLVDLVAALTVASGCVYLWLWVRYMRPQHGAENSVVARRAQ